jgi:type I site-specific restriction endonuclease
LITANQNLEEQARDKIDALFIRSADYFLLVNKGPVGVIETKFEDEVVKLTMHKDQAEGYAKAKLKYINNKLSGFLYESTEKLLSPFIFVSFSCLGGSP